MEMKSFSALFKWPKNWRAPRPPPTLSIFPKSPNQNSEITIPFIVVDKPYNYVFGGDLLPPQSPWEGLQATNFDQCLHIVMVIGKCTDVFRRNCFLVGGRGWEEGDMLERNALETGVKNRNYFVYEKGCFLINTPLFTLKFFTVLKSRVERKSQTLAQRVGCW